MQLYQVIWVTVMLMDGLWGMTRQEESKTRRVSTVTLRRETKKEKIQRNIEKQVQKESDEDEDKKTLSQQVADGKYGLIQRELFSEPVKRPGIISYEVNPEVPKDNVNNLGGLMPEEIWLAENHLLVLKGGSFGGEGKWPAIDNYVAPRRQVKIPQNPKVPPPFPVQLKDNGPIEFIKGKNGSSALPILPFFGGLYPVNETFPGNLRGGNGFDPFPLLLPLPPPVGAFLPRPENLTELDEDDPSIYYPPPYDFYYPKDNSSFVPPGPLVPGIVVPPPPNFFGLLEKKGRTKGSTQKPKLSTQTPARLHTTTAYPLTTATPSTSRTTAAYKPYYKTKQTTSTVSPNEIVHTLPPDTPVGDWIPIPAPRPFYISLKPIKLQQGSRQPGWKYYNTTETRKPNIYDAEPYYYSGFKPIIDPNPVPVYVENYSEKPKYYYYDQPEYETNTLSPPLIVKTSPRNSKYLHTPLDYFIRDKYRTNKRLPITTKKPPVYEYSYSAPGYGTLEAPKIGNNFVTTKQPSYMYDVSTARPYSYNIYQTEYPPYSQSPSSLDAINKKYFTLFGQKLNHEITTPLPKYNKYVTTTPKNLNIYDYNIENDGPLLQNQYYEEKLYYRTTHKPKSYPQFYRAPPPPAQYEYSYNGQRVVAGHPLDSDIRVNYKNPLPPINPDAEFIDHYGPSGSPTTPVVPHLPRGTSLISYQLPGTGGHFYFLTPQAVK